MHTQRLQQQSPFVVRAGGSTSSSNTISTPTSAFYTSLNPSSINISNPISNNSNYNHISNSSNNHNNPSKIMQIIDYSNVLNPHLQQQIQGSSKKEQVPSQQSPNGHHSPLTSSSISQLLKSSSPFNTMPLTTQIIAGMGVPANTLPRKTRALTNSSFHSLSLIDIPGGIGSSSSTREVYEGKGFTAPKRGSAVRVLAPQSTKSSSSSIELVHRSKPELHMPFQINIKERLSSQNSLMRYSSQQQPQFGMTSSSQSKLNFSSDYTCTSPIQSNSLPLSFTSSASLATASLIAAAAAAKSTTITATNDLLSRRIANNFSDSKFDYNSSRNGNMSYRENNGDNNRLQYTQELISKQYPFAAQEQSIPSSQLTERTLVGGILRESQSNYHREAFGTVPISTTSTTASTTIASIQQTADTLKNIRLNPGILNQYQIENDQSKEPRRAQTRLRNNSTTAVPFGNNTQKLLHINSNTYNQPLDLIKFSAKRTYQTNKQPMQSIQQYSRNRRIVNPNIFADFDETTYSGITPSTMIGTTVSPFSVESRGRDYSPNSRKAYMSVNQRSGSNRIEFLPQTQLVSSRIISAGNYPLTLYSTSSLSRPVTVSNGNYQVDHKKDMYQMHYSGIENNDILQNKENIRKILMKQQQNEGLSSQREPNQCVKCEENQTKMQEEGIQTEKKELNHVNEIGTKNQTEDSTKQLEVESPIITGGVENSPIEEVRGENLANPNEQTGIIFEKDQSKIPCFTASFSEESSPQFCKQPIEDQQDFVNEKEPKIENNNGVQGDISEQPQVQKKLNQPSAPIVEEFADGLYYQLNIERSLLQLKTGLNTRIAQLNEILPKNGENLLEFTDRINSLMTLKFLPEDILALTTSRFVGEYTIDDGVQQDSEKGQKRGLDLTVSVPRESILDVLIGAQSLPANQEVNEAISEETIKIVRNIFKETLRAERVMFAFKLRFRELRDELFSLLQEQQSSQGEKEIVKKLVSEIDNSDEVVQAVVSCASLKLFLARNGYQVRDHEMMLLVYRMAKPNTIRISKQDFIK